MLTGTLATAKRALMSAALSCSGKNATSSTRPGEGAGEGAGAVPAELHGARDEPGSAPGALIDFARLPFT